MEYNKFSPYLKTQILGDKSESSDQEANRQESTENDIDRPKHRLERQKAQSRKTFHFEKSRKGAGFLNPFNVGKTGGPPPILPAPIQRHEVESLLSLQQELVRNFYIFPCRNIGPAKYRIRLSNLQK
uniref:Uncharacterized protein n=1 Tax=Tetranychus urticae TaxID=32264 RepID=T1K5G3_TETUR